MRGLNGATLSLLGLALTACASAPPAPPPLQKGMAPAKRETPPVDAAKDPAIWAAPDWKLSRVIGTQKTGGLLVYDLSGALVQSAPGGLPNKVDLRDGFAFGDGTGVVVAATDRSDQSIAFWKLDTETGALDTAVRGRIRTGFAEAFGLCLGRLGADTYAIATGKSGELGVWRLRLGYELKLEGVEVKKFKLGSISEGCVVDDEARAVYVSEKAVGVWRMSLDFDAPAPPVLVDRVGAGGNLGADVAGLALWTAPSGRGYLIASSRGESRFAVYDRKSLAYRGSVRIGAGGGADAVSGADGVEVTSAPLGPDFVRGLMVVRDDQNTDPVAAQNFKYVAWADVEAALGIEAGLP